MGCFTADLQCKGAVSAGAPQIASGLRRPSAVGAKRCPREALSIVVPWTLRNSALIEYIDGAVPSSSHSIDKPYITSLAAMSPSAIVDTLPAGVGNGVSKVMGKEEKHVHGAEDKTPLEAISHGDVMMQGTSGSCTV